MLTKPVAETLALLASQLRGWDQPGVMTQLGKVATRNEYDVAMALVRFCADPGAKTPGAFPNPSGPHWVERARPEEGNRKPPRREDECPDHPGEYAGAICRAHAADKRAVRDAADADRTQQRRQTATDALAAARATLAAAKAAGCKHGPIPCTECRRARTTTTEGASA